MVLSARCVLVLALQPYPESSLIEGTLCCFCDALNLRHRRVC